MDQMSRLSNNMPSGSHMNMPDGCFIPFSHYQPQTYDERKLFHDTKSGTKAIAQTPIYVGGPEEMNDFRFDFNAPEVELSHDDEEPLSASWDDFSMFPLLQLPKEIRIRIYEYALSPDDEPVVVEFERDVSPRKGYNPFSKVRQDPKLRYRRSPYHPLAAGLIRTCKQVHEEAQPILYSRVTFHPLDNHGLLPIFLRLQGEAKRFIRSIRLSRQFIYPYHQPDAHFHWTVTCAQVAKIGSSLHQVEILYIEPTGNEKEPKPQCLLESDTTENGLGNFSRSFALPLCKIGAPKHLVFLSNTAPAAQSALLANFETFLRIGHERMLSSQRDKARHAERRKLFQTSSQPHGAPEYVPTGEAFQIDNEWDLVDDFSFLDDSDWEDLKVEYEQYKQEYIEEFGVRTL